MEFLQEYRHSYGDGQSTGHGKMKARTGTLKVQNLTLNVLLLWETYQNENEGEAV